MVGLSARETVWREQWMGASGSSDLSMWTTRMSSGFRSCGHGKVPGGVVAGSEAMLRLQTSKAREKMGKVERHEKQTSDALSCLTIPQCIDRGATSLASAPRCERCWCQ